MSTSDFNDNYLEILLNNISNFNKPVFLAGVFNFNLLKQNDHPDTDKFLSILHSHYLLG